MAVLMYQSEFPLVELSACASILRNGELATKKSRFAKSVWIIQSYGQKLALGDPDAATGGEVEPLTEESDHPAITTDLECACKIETLVAPVGDGNAEAFTFPWPLLKPIVAYLAQKALDLLMRKLQPAG